MNKLETKDLCKSFAKFRAVSNLSLQFDSKKIHAVIGENGAGKSTLMKLLFGLLQPSSGQIFIDGSPVAFASSRDAIKAGIGMVHQHFCLVENLSALDNIILGNEMMSGASINRKAALKSLIDKLPDESLHVPWHEKVLDLSVGFRQRIEILKLIYLDSQFLILDEPTAVLTPQEIVSFFAMLKKLRDMGRTIILITHKLNEVFAVCDDYHVLRQGELVASGEVSKTTQAQIVQYMIGRELKPLASRSANGAGQNVLEVNDVVGGRLKKISLKLGAGEILGLAGVEGSGQSSLVEAILGLIEFEGDIRVLGARPDSTREVRDLGVALIPEDRHSQAIWLEESLAKNAVIGIEEKFSNGISFLENKIHETSGAWLKNFDVRFGNLDQPISSLSGGNQQKLVFAREVLGRQPRLIICHQPTRGVDLGAIEKIHGEILRLRDAGVSCLLISSELDELMALSDRICVLFDGEVTGNFERNSFSRAAIGQAMTGKV